MNRTLRVFAVAGLAAVTSVAAEAATFQFSDMDRASTGAFSVTSDNMNLTVSGRDGDASATVKTDEGHGLSVGSHYVDGSEHAVFSFDQTVTLQSFGASHVDWGDQFKVLGWTGDSWQILQHAWFGLGFGFGQAGSHANFELSDHASTFASRHFAVRSVGWLTQFKITNVVAHGVSEVPVPAPGLLLLAGLGALAFRRRAN